MDFKALAAEFPRDAIHWRAQTLTKNGDKALALAYLDARDVMDRLDEVCGPDRWQSSFTETPKGRVICTISIHTENGWISKSDGAGNTDVEGEKGGISDALKRAAVSWGIGRYLYRLDAVWAPCKTYENSSGKKVWSEWVGSPWDAVRGAKTPPKRPAPPKQPERDFDPAPTIELIKESIGRADTVKRLTDVWIGQKAQLDEVKATAPALYGELVAYAAVRKSQLDPALQAPQEAAE